MSCTISGPFSECLANEEERYSQSNEEDSKSSINHNGCDIAGVDYPVIEELGHAIRPQIFDHRRRNENLSSDWLVAIDLLIMLLVFNLYLL